MTREEIEKMVQDAMFEKEAVSVLEHGAYISKVLAYKITRIDCRTPSVTAEYHVPKSMYDLHTPKGIIKVPEGFMRRYLPDVGDYIVFLKNEITMVPSSTFEKLFWQEEQSAR